MPAKWDAGGRVQDARAESLDSFTADVDNSAGSSGGGVFDSQLALLGITARGGFDYYVKTLEGCRTTVREANAASTAEQIGHAFRAVAGLCAEGPTVSSLCRSDCGSPCQALPRPPDSPEGGCALVPQRPAGPWPFAAAVLALAGRRRRKL